MNNIDLDKIFGTIEYKRYSIKIASRNFLEIKSNLFISHGLQEFTDIDDLYTKISEVIKEFKYNDLISALNQIYLIPHLVIKI